MQAYLPEQHAFHPSPTYSGGRRPAEDTSPAESENRRKTPKVTRACDLCKTKKIRCSGTNPCDTCSRRALLCSWDAAHVRGRPPTPPPSGRGSDAQTATHGQARYARFEAANNGHHYDSATGHGSSRASPEHEAAETDGQFHDRTSGLTFMHRAWRRLSKNADVSGLAKSEESRTAHQNVTMTGDKPLDAPHGSQETLIITRDELRKHFDYYFDTCSVTYRLFHQPGVRAWVEEYLAGFASGPLPTGLLENAKTACLLSMFAIATFRRDQVTLANTSHRSETRQPNTEQSDQFFREAQRLTTAETGHARLESVQARLLQVLYLLQTQRTNQAWYLFGAVIQMTSALGLHRAQTKAKAAGHGRPNVDYIDAQCRKRTFWAAYIIDTYLCVVLGRPKHYHDDDIDQTFPDSVVDEDITVSGPVCECEDDSPVDGLIWHAKLAQIISATSRDVYTVQRVPSQTRLAAIHRLGDELRHWKSSLPPHLGTVRASSLVPALRRQSIALKLAYSHALMHAHRAILMEVISGHLTAPQVRQSIGECIRGARSALETVDAMAKDGALLYSLWWTQYVLFCALSVVSVFTMHLGRAQLPLGDEKSEDLLRLAERCKTHLSIKYTASQKYIVILEELMREAQREETPQNHAQGTDVARLPTQAGESGLASTVGDGWDALDSRACFDGWDPSDWLDLDSSAYIPLLDIT